MQILFITRLYYPHVGGIEKHITELSRILLKRGHQIKVLTTKYEPNLKNEEIKNGIKVVRFNQPRIKYLGFIYTWIWILKNRKLIKESDFIHIHDVFIWYWPFKIIYPRKKIFLTIHGQWGDYPVSWADKIQKKFGAKFCNGVISIGKYINKYYGIKSDIVSYGAVNIVKRDKEAKKYSVILYVGRLDKNTGLKVLNEMLSKHNNKFEVIYCGDGELREECERYGKVVGWTNTEKYYQKAKFVFASGYLTILEALSNKCMVIAGYNNPLQKDYYKLTPFSKYFFASDNPDTLWQKLQDIENHPKYYQILSEKGYNWAKEQTWDNMADNYEILWSK